jgi:hypothetical protein
MQFNITVYSNTNTMSGSKQVVQLHPDDSEYVWLQAEWDKQT